MNTGASARRALFWLLMANLVLVAWVFRPLAIALFLAMVLTGVLAQSHDRLSRALHGRSRLAATLLLVGVVVLLLGPLIALSAFVVKEAAGALSFVSETVRSEGVLGLIGRLPRPFEKIARQAIEHLPTEPGAGLDEVVQQQVSAQGGKAAAAVGAVVAGTGALLFQAAMMLIALFFLLTNRARVVRWIDDASPLATGQTTELLQEFRNVSGAVVRSTVLTAGVQAVVALIGYFIAKVPFPLFFAAITFFVAMIPAVGAASVCLAAAVLLLLSGHTVAAIFLAAWGVIVVGLVDNVVKPLFIRNGVEMNGAIVFFALLGGLAAFGAIGLLLGPLAVASFIAMLRIYQRDYGTPGEPQTPEAPALTERPTRRLVAQPQE